MKQRSVSLPLSILSLFIAAAALSTSGLLYLQVQKHTAASKKSQAEMAEKSQVDMAALHEKIAAIKKTKSPNLDQYLKIVRLEVKHEPLDLIRATYKGKFSMANRPYIVYDINSPSPTTAYYSQRGEDLLNSIEITQFLEKDNLAVALIRLKEGLTEYHESMWFERASDGWLISDNQYFSKYSKGRLVRGKTDWIEATSDIVTKWKEAGEQLP